MQNQDSFQGQFSPLLPAGDILDDSTLSGTLGSAASDTLTPVRYGPAMMPTQTFTGIDGVNANLFDSSDSIAEQGLNGVVSLYQNGRTSAQNLVDRVIEVPVVNTAMQTSADLANSASEVASQTIDFTKDKAQEVVASVRGLANTASKSWNAPDNQAHNALKEQTGRFVNGLSQLASTVDDSERMDKVRQYLDTATDYFSTLTDGVYSELGYVNSSSVGPQEAELAAAERRLKENLIDLRNSSDFLSTLESAFGDRWEPAEAEALVDDFTSGKAAPHIEIVAADSLRGAAAYGDNTIFISEQYLANSATQPETLDAVLLEEAGHYLDDQLNETDSAGDEGAIFAKLAQDETIAAAELTALRNENDHAKLWFENKEIDVENFDLGGSLSSFGSSVTDSLSSFGSSAADSLSSFGSSAADSLSSFGSSATDSLSSFGSSAVDSLSSFGSSATDSLSSFGSSASDSLSSFGSSASDSLSSFGSSAYNGLSSGLSSLGSSASDSLSSFGSSASDTLSSFGSSAYNGLSSGLSSLGSSASDSLSSFGSSASDSFSSLGSSAYNGLSSFGSSASDSLNNFGSSAYNGLSDFGNSASNSLNNFGSSAYNGLSGFSDTAFGTFNNFGSTAADTWNSVTETAGAATDYVASTVDTVTNTATDALGAATDAVVETTAVATDYVADTTAAVTETATNAWNGVTEAATNAWDNVTEVATTATDFVVDTATDATDAIVDTTTAATNYVVDTTVAATDAVVDGAIATSDYIGETLEPVADFTASVATSVGDAVSDTATAVTEFATEDVPKWVAENESTVNRGVGVLQTIGGLGEIVAGAALVPTGTVSFGAGTVAGAGIAAHGADTTWAGLKAIWTGESQETYTQQGITAVADAIPGVSTEDAKTVGAIGDFGLGLAGSVGAVSKLAKGGVDNVVTSTIDDVAENTAAAVTERTVDDVAKSIVDDVPSSAINKVDEGAIASGEANLTDTLVDELPGGTKVVNDASTGRTTFFHGTAADIASEIRVQGIDLSKGSDFSDFGKGFYLTNSKDEALQSASRLYGDRSLDVVTFDVPNSELSKLSGLTFSDAGADWQDFVRFHKTHGPQDLLHGGEAYDVVNGPLFRRYTGETTPVAWPDRTPQTSIHTQSAVDTFNRYTVKDK
jgi:hypothetical protein